MSVYVFSMERFPGKTTAHVMNVLNDCAGLWPSKRERDSYPFVLNYLGLKDGVEVYGGIERGFADWVSVGGCITLQVRVLIDPSTGKGVLQYEQKDTAGFDQNAKLTSRDSGSYPLTCDIVHDLQ